MKKLPIVNNSIKVGTLGFYELLKSINCPLSGLSAAKVILSGDLPATRTTKQQIIGDFFHTLIDQTKDRSRASIIENSQELIKKFKIKYSKYFEQNPSQVMEEWPEVAYSMRYLSRKKSNDLKVDVHKETLFFSQDNRFKGKPDLLEVYSSCANLVDYKSSTIYEIDGKVKADYFLQLQFYALLVYENFPEVSEIKCSLVGLRNEKFEFSILRENELKALSEKFNKIYEEIELNFAAGNSTNPSIENCNHCNYKIVCKDYLRSQDQLAAATELHILRGKFHGTETKNGELFLMVENWKIRVPLSEYNSLAFKIGDEYVFSNLKKSFHIFIFGSMTEIYEC